MISTRFPRKESGSILLGLRPAQVALIAVAVGMTVLGLLGQVQSVTRTLMLTSGPLVGIAAMTPIEGMPAYRWLMLRTLDIVRRARGRNSYRVNLVRPSRLADLHLPGQVAVLRLMDQRSRIGVLHDPRLKRLTAVARVLGPAHLLQDSEEQDRRVVEYGRLVAGLCRGGRRIARAQILERTLPDAADGLVVWARSRCLDPATPAGSIYQDLLDRAAPAPARHETLIGLSLDLVAVAKEIRKHGGGLVGAAKVLEAEARAFQGTLVAAGVNGRWLSAGEIAAVVRTAFDPAAAGKIEQRSGSLPTSAALPMAIDVAWDHVRTDSSYQRVYQVDEWPRIHVTSGFLSPLLLRPGIRRTFSIVMQPIPVSKALRDARRDRVERVTDRATRSRIGQIETEQDRQTDADVAQRERDLAEGHADVRWVGLLAVSADSLDELDDACAQMELAASQAMLDLRRVVGQQAEAFVAAALPFCAGIE
jgi:hypothetical protein